jgi:YesN/AraC family two-component response regulator
VRHRHREIGGEMMREDWTGEHFIRSVPRAVKDAAAQEIESRKPGTTLVAVNAIKQMGAQGLTLSRIAKELKYSRPYICQLAKQHGIILPDGRGKRRGA